MALLPDGEQERVRRAAREQLEATQHMRAASAQQQVRIREMAGRIVAMRERLDALRARLEARRDDRA